MPLASVLLVRNDASTVVFDVLAFRMISAGYPVDSVKEQVHYPLECGCYRTLNVLLRAEKA